MSDGDTVPAWMHQLCASALVVYCLRHCERFRPLRCVRDMLVKVEVQLAQGAAKARRAAHGELMAAKRKQSKAKGVREDICWEFVVTGVASTTVTALMGGHACV